MAAKKVIDEIVISDDDDDIICDTPPTPTARCALCWWPVKEEAEDKRSHIVSHFNPRYNTQIKHPSELTHPSEHYNNFIRLHHECFPKKFPKTQYVTPKPEPDEEEEEEEELNQDQELQENTPESEEPKELFECIDCGRAFEKQRHLKIHCTATHVKEKLKRLPSIFEKPKERPAVQQRTPKPQEPKTSFVHRDKHMNLVKSKKATEPKADLEVPQKVPGLMECKDCGQSFKSDRGLNIHRGRTHGIYSRYFCNKCHEQLGDQINTHVRKVHVHGDFRCSKCPYRAEHKSYVRGHINNKKHSVVHGPADIITLDQTYPERFEQFKDQFIVNLADQEVPKIGEKINKKQKTPTENGKRVQDRQSMNRDRKTALYCRVCDYVFKPSLHLSVKGHLANVHLKEETLFCSKCNYSIYYNMHQIKQHTKIHGGKAEIRDERHTIEEKLQRLRDENIITVRIDAHSKMITDDSRENSEEKETEVNEDVNQEGNEMETESGEEQQGAKKYFCIHCERLFVSAERFKKHQELVKSMERLARTLIRFRMKGKKKRD